MQIGPGVYSHSIIFFQICPESRFHNKLVHQQTSNRGKIAQEAIWMQQLSSEFIKIWKLTNLLSMKKDNQAAIAIAKNEKFNNRTKYINILTFHVIRERISSNKIKLVFHFSRASEDPRFNSHHGQAYISACPVWIQTTE